VRDVLFCTACRRWSVLSNGVMRYLCPVTGADWCGECYANQKCRSNYRGHMGYRRPKSTGGSKCMALKIPSLNGNGSSPTRPASVSTEYLKDFGNLLEFLSSLSGEGSSRREAGSVSLTTKDGKWTLRLKDPTNKVYCYVVAPALDEALQIVELGLADGSLDWRRDTTPQARK